jgi:uncharacterized membrane-anchored protein
VEAETQARTAAPLGRWITPRGREMLNKVPEVTIYFWMIKVLCTTVGETASDNLSENLNLGLTKTTFFTGGLLLVTLFFQFRAWRYGSRISACR